jgi:hypothetical protein
VIHGGLGIQRSRVFTSVAGFAVVGCGGADDWYDVLVVVFQG